MNRKIEMRRSLGFKLVVAFLVVSVIAVVLVAVSSAAVTAFEFNRLVTQEATNSFVAYVTDYYTTHGNLDGLEQALRPTGVPATRTPDQPRIFPTALADPQGVVILGGEGFAVGETVPAQAFSNGTPIEVNGKVIAISLPRPAPPPRTRAQDQFIQNSALTLGLATVGASLVSVLLGLLLARTITRPVMELTAAARRMALGALGLTVNARSRDEIGELANAFNQMSTGLARADQTRRQMTADIAHELRNPLTVIGGYLDAMRAGDLAPTPPRLEAVYGEIEHLEHLVEELRTLSLAEAGALKLHRQPLAPGELLSRVASRHGPQAQQKKIALAVQANGELPEITVDETRMMQVFDNLIGNALRHTPPEGQVRLSAKRVDDKIDFSVADTGEGIRPEDLTRIFERFYRADGARGGSGGESGLGLAIAKALVEAHGGTIHAESILGQGATIVVELPVEGADIRIQAQ